jgi:hypothetical protein
VVELVQIGKYFIVGGTLHCSQLSSTLFTSALSNPDPLAGTRSGSTFAGKPELSVNQGLDDRLYQDKVVAKADYDKALAKWENASPEEKLTLKELLDYAKDLLDAANKNLNDFINQPKQHAPSPGAFLGQQILHCVQRSTSILVFA